MIKGGILSNDCANGFPLLSGFGVKSTGTSEAFGGTARRAAVLLGPLSQLVAATTSLVMS